MPPSGQISFSEFLTFAFHPAKHNIDEADVLHFENRLLKISGKVSLNYFCVFVIPLTRKELKQQNSDGILLPKFVNVTRNHFKDMNGDLQYKILGYLYTREVHMPKVQSLHIYTEMSQAVSKELD